MKLVQQLLGLKQGLLVESLTVKLGFEIWKECYTDLELGVNKDEN